jgi:hypothetical protein
MVEAIHLIYGADATGEMAPEASMLHELFMELFAGRGVQFFDAEPDDEFLSVFDGARNLPAEKRRKALEDFKRELMLDQQFFGEYGKMSEMLIQSEDYLDNIRVPFLVFNLSDEDDMKDPSYAFRLDAFHVFYVAGERFVVLLKMRSTLGNHLEVYLRFGREEASRVVKAILGVFEEYMGCDNSQAPCHSIKDVCMEEMYTHVIQRFNESQLKPAKGVSEIGLRKVDSSIVCGRRHGA